MNVCLTYMRGRHVKIDALKEKTHRESPEPALMAGQMVACRGRRRRGPVIHQMLVGCILASLSLIALPSFSQTAEEHASHHPGAVAPGASSPTMPSPTPVPAAPPAAGGSMGEMMGKMMAPPAADVATPAPANAGVATPPPASVGPIAPAGMPGMPAGASAGGCGGGGCGSAAAAKTPIYPSLMTLPALTPEKRAEIDALARQQIDEGMARLTSGTASLNSATKAGDNAALQHSVGMIREGVDELGAGIAARRVLSEGKAPRNLALDWFKREMNLASPISNEEPRATTGVTVFHLFTMGLLIAFALAMLIMYFFKMRRAAALFGRLESGSGSPPGTSPPLAGGPSPSSPGDPSPPSKTPPPPGPPPSLAVSQSNSSTEPSTENSPASGESAGAPSLRVAPTGSPANAERSPSPLTANWQGQLRVGSIVTETPSVKTLRLVSSSDNSLMPFTFVPGQFLNVAFSIGGARMNRSYSISSSPTRREHVDLTVRREPRGAVSRHIDDLLKIGDQIEAGGPIGRFTFSGVEADSIVLLAGGVGITPMMSIIRYLTEQAWTGDIFLLYACRTPTDFIFANEIAALQRVNAKLHVTVTMSNAEGTDWKGPRGRLTKELLTRAVPNLTSRRIHLCGPPLMMESTKAILTELGVAPAQVKTEAFGTPKPAPAAAGTSAKLSAPPTGPLVTFSKNHKSAKIHIDQTILELSEELAIGIEFSCRVGTCGVCKVKMTSGEVEMAVQDALEAADKANDIILACQAKPRADVAVEA
jgi:ferredoxin-NADP reductase